MSTTTNADLELAIPTAESEVTPAWVSQALSPHYPGAKVSALRLEPINVGMAMTARLHLEYAADSAPGPASVCIKCCFGSPYSEYSMEGRLYSKEAIMYAEILPQTQINAPTCLASGYDDSTQSAYILLEDMSLTGGTFCTAEISLTPDQVEDVLHQLASLHAMSWGKDWVAEPRWVHHGVPIGEPDPFYDVMSEKIPQMLKLPRGGTVPASLRDKPTLTAAVYRLLASAALDTQCLLHGDCHTSNLLIDGQGRAGIADWQCGRIGSWALDVGYMMMSALDPEDRRLHEKRLLESYLAKMAELGIEMPQFERAWDLYRMSAIYGMWLWLITPPDMHPEPRITATVHKYAVAAMDLQSFDAIPD